jgi:CRP-like cAMP-binding protein
MSGVDHKLDDLRRLDLLSHCSDDELRTIASTADLIAMRSGDVLRSHDGGDRSFFLLLSGVAALGTDALLSAGDSDGAVGLLGGDPDTDELRMLGDGRVLVASPRQFAGLINGVPGFARAIAEDLSRRLRAQHRTNFGEPNDHFE